MWVPYFVFLFLNIFFNFFYQYHEKIKKRKKNQYKKFINSTFWAITCFSPISISINKTPSSKKPTPSQRTLAPQQAEQQAQIPSWDCRVDGLHCCVSGPLSFFCFLLLRFFLLPPQLCHATTMISARLAKLLCVSLEGVASARFQTWVVLVWSALMPLSVAWRLVWVLGGGLGFGLG